MSGFLDFTPAVLMQRVMLLVPMILSLSVHEWAHAWSAFKLGDDTAKMQGRLTLNPMAHIDPIGTLLLPLLGIPFGWARPVPINPARFRREVHMSTGMALSASAGPLSNLILAVLCAVSYGVLYRVAPGVLEEQGVQLLLRYGIELNVGLAVFNLVPIPPLDGSRILERLMPYSMRATWDAFQRMSPFLLIAFIYFGAGLLSGPRNALTNVMFDLIRRIVRA